MPKKLSNKELVEGVRKRDVRAISRLITLIEDEVPRAREVLAELYRLNTNSHVVGITGAPGAGKSTLVDQLALLSIRAGRTVAVLAVDPSSPFSGGAVLGDRIRMHRSLAERGVFVRSMATRGALGGLARATLEAVQVLQAAQFDLILIETVGVGQGEVDIVRTADSCIVVLVPGMGDEVQAIKAGVLEIADLFVINKADRDGADSLERELKTLLSLVMPDEGSWQPSVFRTVATAGTGIAELLPVLDSHRQWLASSAAGQLRKLQIVENNLVRLAGEMSHSRALKSAGTRVQALARDCMARKIDPYRAVEEILSYGRV